MDKDFRPESAEMNEGETNRCLFVLAPLVGANTIVGTPGIESSPAGLTFTSPSISGTTVTSFVSGGQGGMDYLVTLTAALSSGEVKVKSLTLEWKSPGARSRAAA